MLFSRIKPLLTISLFLFSFVFLLPMNADQGPVANVQFSSYTLELHSSLFHEVLTITNSTFSGNVTGEFKVNETTTSYAIASGKVTQYKGELTVSVGDNGTIQVSSPAPLVEVEVNSGSQEEIAWAGTPSKSVSGYAYVNGSGTVKLLFLNGTQTDSMYVNVTAGNTTSVPIDLYLNVPSLTVKSTHTAMVAVNVNHFERYHGAMFNYTSNSVMQANFNAHGDYSVSLSYFDGKEVPSMVWRASTFSGVALLGNLHVSFMTVEFFGVNGTEAGTVQTFYVSNQVNVGSMFGIDNLVQHSRLLIVHFLGAKVTGGRSFELMVSGQPVLVQYGNGSVTSTAYVNFTHPVHRGVLVEVFVNNTHFIFVNSSNVSPVVQARPVVTHVVIHLNSTQTTALEAQINATGYAVFNLSVSNSSLVVYKEVQGHLVLVSHDDYFMVNNTLVVFSDPAQQYFVVYTSAQPSSSTSSSSTSSSSTSPSTSSSAPSTTPQSSSTSVSSTSSSVSSTSSSVSSTSSSVPPSPSTSSQPNYTLYIVAIIVVIIVALGIAFVLKR